MLDVVLVEQTGGRFQIVAAVDAEAQMIQADALATAFRLPFSLRYNPAPVSQIKDVKEM